MALIKALTGGDVSDFEEVFKQKDITTNKMQQAYSNFYSLYYDDSVTPDKDCSMRLPYTIVNKLKKTVFSEYDATLAGEGYKNELIRLVLDAIEREKNTIVQNTLIAGECLIKPVLYKDSFVFTTIPRTNYSVFAKNDLGEITSCATSEKTIEGNFYYTFFEKRSVDENGYLTLEYKLYRSSEKSEIGEQVPLSQIEQYSHLEPINTLPKPVYSIGLIQHKTLIENCVDGSHSGVSIYAGATSVIEQAYKLEAQLNTEFCNSESRIMVASDLLEYGELTDNVFTAIDEDPESVGITIFNPNIREQSYLNRKNDYLRTCENVIGLKRGILSDVEAVERTATEITSSEGDYNLTIIDLQKAWTTTAKEIVRVCDILGQIYYGWDSTKYSELEFDYGDGVLFNREKTWEEYSYMVASGLLKPEIALAWYFNRSSQTSDDLQSIRKDYMPTNME